MDWQALFGGWVGADVPWLPSLVVSTVAQHVFWACVLGAGGAWLGRGLSNLWRWLLAGVLMVWALVPGAVSPTYWLGLSFQSPSVLSALLCGSYLVRQAVSAATWRMRSPLTPQPSATLFGPGGVAYMLAGAVLGWVLLLDVLALWPVSVYAWGFGRAALLLTALVVTGLWVIGHRGGGAPRVPGLLLWVLVVFVVSRVPTGNVWDALLDPLLWLILQVNLARTLLRRRGVD